MKTKPLYILFFLYVLISLVAAAQGLFAPLKVFTAGAPAYKDYNNYVIFKYSFFHLIHRQDIYQYFPADHWDLFKYSPAFALLFAPLSILPDYLGLPIWMLINALVLFAGVALLPRLSNAQKSWLLLFCLPELLTSLQNDQSNGLMAGLIILGFALAERSKFFWSTLCIVASIYIKLFGGLALVFYLFYPGKVRNGAYVLFWMVVLTLIPMVAVGWHQLSFLYQSWYHLVLQDRASSVGISVVGLLETWGGLHPSANVVALVGLLLFCLPLIHVKKYADPGFRLLMLASVLIWIVIFNHKAESPTFIIAMAGIGVWYFSRKPSTSDTILLFSALLVTSLSVSDLVPAEVRRDFVVRYDLKAVMPVLIWVRILWLALTVKPIAHSDSPTFSPTPS